MEEGSEKKFPVNAKDYKLYEEVGEGVSATVYRALCIPLNEIVAVKVLDLERCNNDLDGIRREVQTMTLINHPNVLRSYCSFTAGHSLWVVMPYMAGGSCLHIMKSSFPEGFEEPVIATLLREVLKALVYIHYHGHIHRDVKAGNILVDTNGAVKLADFGVAACMFDTGDRQRSRNTFVGTPCWMAPEVMQQLHGYDFKADIWSFGITALELAHGHAPFSKYPPMKVLLMTLQNAPPGLDYERDKRFSKSFKEMVAACLVKDPKKRPSSEKLLKHHFFKQGRSNDYLSRTILEGLPPLGDRYRMLKAKEADVLVQNKALYEDKEHLSQQEYIRGISAWNFNLEDLKNQASLIQDDEFLNAEGPSSSGRPRDSNDDASSSSDRPNHSLDAPAEVGLHEVHDLEDSLAGFPIKPLQALKGCFDVCEDDTSAGSPNWKYSIRSDSEQQNDIRSLNKGGGEEGGRDDENIGQSISLACSGIPGQKKLVSGSPQKDNILSLKSITTDGERDYPQTRYQPERSYSGPLQYRQKKDNDTSEGAVVQRKGRFKVTSADLSPKGPTNSFFNSASGGLTAATSGLTATSVLPSLQCIFQQNTLQREEIIKLIKYVEQTPVTPMELVESGTTDLSQIPSTSTREKELQSQVIQLQQSIGSLVEQLQRQKIKNVQLESKLNALLRK
ncbi:serine/threonine-protein kinase BLUS1 isoform X1 [Ipomoea triloba]|uniref:serine/threonine-protein kinase BLUS1 isoform X1 n=1 Tax=Ipomoea triloba TaxID=35885 RepID=UPI00125E0D1F|nr:serine/threonine-protein kinase BLUS1 isoform X1 [Ipomoea triloba]XP_031108065.1 serine/threonine-protein kinase BLUS1 isoform X1 [Ipomoea triloba]XP_031108066.1 serine/threonine-protein kinase BLUS1 isoform X1 [Ipomoea triloba]XP_031108067.1 serine/threonine-protein kinase BLUS1 isoform X1 [Ipomoea triloba]XP_031108068.1 serine/threonine-protein kinase BLUS1 isoform X1 [Ipomoea triloba]XP_031108069.1 serine/threonine-protein kinase BLUS1 isoform X1 [Ipomoea triloba]XP_031108070.1 serine/t